MCYIVIITEASPSYKLPGAYVTTRRCSNVKEVEEFKNEYATTFCNDHDFIAHPEDVWKLDYEVNFWNGRGMMDMNPITCEVIECLCESRYNLNAPD